MAIYITYLLYDRLNNKPPWLNMAFSARMDMVWEDCAEALIHQQFKCIYDKFSILKDNPKAKSNSIGVFGSYLFDAILL